MALWGRRNVFFLSFSNPTECCSVLSGAAFNFQKSARALMQLRSSKDWRDSLWIPGAVTLSRVSVLSAEMDEEDYERRRSECLDEMSDLEKQFSELKEK